MSEKIIIGQSDALIVVDVQNDFCPGGALAVPEGDAVVAPINALMALFDHVILTQDWHPSGHSSFASSHDGKAVFDTVKMPYGIQVLWPDHCVAGSRGAEFHPDLDITKPELVIRKGFRLAIDSYSTFFENDKTTATGLGGYLRGRGFKRLFLTGLVAEYCVGFSALDGVTEGFEVFQIDDAVGVMGNDALTPMRDALQAAGVTRITSADLT